MPLDVLGHMATIIAMLGVCGGLGRGGIESGREWRVVWGQRDSHVRQVQKLVMDD